MTTAEALALTAIGGIASAAQAAPAGAPHLSLHNLHLINGWQSAAPKFRTSGPAYAIQDGVVYLNGSITQPSPGDPVFAVLPKAARPAHRMWVTDYTIEGSTGILVISTNGMMTATSSDPDNNAAQFTSIAGVSFPARSTTLHKLALRNGWQSDQHAFLSGDPSYTVRNGIVHLAGSLSHPRAGGPEFAVLPKGARPAHKILIDVYTDGGVPGRLLIGTDGAMRAFAGAALLFTSLASISFPVPSVTVR